MMLRNEIPSDAQKWIVYWNTETEILDFKIFSKKIIIFI